MSEKEHAALLKVAEAAAVLFRPPYRRWCGIVGLHQEQEKHDFDRLYEALNNKDCPVDIGEELT